MLPNSTEAWTDLIGATLRAYEDPLLRRVATKLCRPRSQWPAAELINRCVEVFTNPPTLDRRLKDLESTARQLLAAIGHSRQPRWPVGSLVEIAAMLGASDALAAVQALLEAGMAFPVLPDKTRLRSFESWLGQATEPCLVASPSVTDRILADPLSLVGPGTVDVSGPVHEADGLDLPLRLAVLWQQVAGGPLRRTQNGDFFKRDLDRLRGDPLLATAPADDLAELPDLALFSSALGQAAGLIVERDGELQAGAFSPAWQQHLPEVIVELLAALPAVQGWNAANGWQPGAGPGNPYPAANLMALLTLASLPEGAWAASSALAAWILERHPYWRSSSTDEASTSRRGVDAQEMIDATGIVRFLLGVAYPLRLCQAAKTADGTWAVRLAPLGRWALGFSATPPEIPTFPQTLLVQPNLEILAYRQGLTPELLVKLTRFATWRTLGAACTLQLEPHSVYRALESGESQASIVQTLERHSMKPTPAPVLDAIKTWSNKRERITIYPSAVLLEFSTPAELNEALSRGLPGVRLTDRLAAVASESQIDYKHFRLTGTRDYCLPPEPCVEVDNDGVTLRIDLARSDLMLDSELQRFAEPAAVATTPPGRRVYRVTPASVAAARNQGWSLNELSSWYTQRTGLPISPAAKLLFTGAELPPVELRRQLVLHVSSEEAADGLVQWPATGALIRSRLGPTAVVLDETNAAALNERLREMGIRIVHEEG